MIGPIKVSRSIKELLYKIKDLQREYLCEKGRDITVLEISKILKVSKEDVSVALESEKPIDSINEESYDDKQGEAKISKISDGKDEEELLINKLCINNMINDLQAREKQIILLRYFRDKTQSEVAKMLGVTQVQISRIEKKILQNMKEELTSG